MVGCGSAASRDLQDESAAGDEKIAGEIHGYIDGRGDGGNLLRDGSEVTGGGDVKRIRRVDCYVRWVRGY